MLLKESILFRKVLIGLNRKIIRYPKQWISLYTYADD